VRIRRDGRLSFEAPPLTRSGPVDDADVDAIARALAVPRADILDTAWIDNGPGWVGVLLRDADAVLAIEPDWAAFGDLKVGVVGPYADGPVAAELRAFCPGYGMPEDPVTGSLNAGVGQWLAGDRLPAAYVAAQGTALQRAGRVHVELVDGQVWVGGDTRTTVSGTVSLD
jgi:PhzF family phenazine biosynthesis protein